MDRSSEHIANDIPGIHVDVDERVAGEGLEWELVLKKFLVYSNSALFQLTIKSYNDSLTMA